MSQEQANQMLMRTIKIPHNSLDKFIKKTIIDPPDIFIPKQKDINLKEPYLKNKGICKKKNINNKYEEGTNIEEKK